LDSGGIIVSQIAADYMKEFDVVPHLSLYTINAEEGACPGPGGQNRGTTGLVLTRPACAPSRTEIKQEDDKGVKGSEKEPGGEGAAPSDDQKEEKDSDGNDGVLRLLGVAPVSERTPMKNYTKHAVVILPEGKADGEPVFVYPPHGKTLDLEFTAEITPLPFHVPKDGILVPVRAPREPIGLMGHDESEGMLQQIIVTSAVAKYIKKTRVPGIAGVHIPDHGTGAIRDATGSICGTSGLVYMGV